MNMPLMQAANAAKDAGMISPAAHAELAKVGAIDWATILKVLPTILSLIPGAGQLAGLIPAIVALIQFFTGGIKNVPVNDVPDPG